jgi:phage shock protein A
MATLLAEKVHKLTEENTKLCNELNERMFKMFDHEKTHKLLQQQHAQLQQQHAELQQQHAQLQQQHAQLQQQHAQLQQQHAQLVKDCAEEWEIVLPARP